MDATETKTIGKYKIEIFMDEDPISPREDDNLGMMVCFHRRYTLGDKHDFSTPHEFRKSIRNKRKIGIILPLYLYDHSGITMNTTGFDCPWDSGQVGWIFITREKIRKEYSKQRISKQLMQRVKEYLLNEVKTYDQYLTGDVYGFRITEINPDEPDEEGENIDSCWGYYGNEYCMKEAEEIVKHLIGADKEGQLELQMK
jgi:hypothetical protein